jgi:hypothetical protein
MRRASYRVGFRWIAADGRAVEAGAVDPYHPLDSLTPAGRVAVELLAALFGVERERVAADVMRVRRARA